MTIRYRITKDDYESADAATQALYTEQDGAYVLTVEGMPVPEDTGALKRAKDHEKEQRKQAESRMYDLEKKLQELSDQENRKKGDVDAVEKSYQKKLSELEAKAKSDNDRLGNLLKRNTVESEARRIANDLSGPNADILLPHIYSRLNVEIDDEGAKIRVLDDKGNPTADTLDDLKQFFFTNDRYAPIIVGSKASGSGATGSKPPSGVNNVKKISEMNATEEALFARENPDKYQQMLDQESN